MTDADQTLARIDEVLGFTEDMSIEWDYSTSPDAMRSRPASDEWPRPTPVEELPHRVQVCGANGYEHSFVTYIYDESHLITEETAWRELFGQIVRIPVAQGAFQHVRLETSTTANPDLEGE